MYNMADIKHVTLSTNDMLLMSIYIQQKNSR